MYRVDSLRIIETSWKKNHHINNKTLKHENLLRRNWKLTKTYTNTQVNRFSGRERSSKRERCHNYLSQQRKKKTVDNFYYLSRRKTSISEYDSLVLSNMNKISWFHQIFMAVHRAPYVYITPHIPVVSSVKTKIELQRPLLSLIVNSSQHHYLFEFCVQFIRL